jgi:hypothetical protein
LNVIPEQSGLRLEFILEPAYYLGIIEFPGALKAFSYTRLLQTINYPAGEPYDEGTQTLVESIRVEGNRTQPVSALAPYSQSEVDQDRSRLIAAYLTLGYPNTTFRSTVSRVGGNRHRVSVTYVIG